MISRILVPTDFSEVANNELKYAIGFAVQTKASIHVLHVKNFPVMDFSFPAEMYSTLIEEMETIARKGIDKIETTLLKPSGVTYTTESVAGFVNDEIEKCAEANNIDLIVMGTTGASGIQELLVGSNAATTIARSEIPVLVIPPTATFTEFKNIAYASDYTEPEFPALLRLLFFAELNDASITVLHVKSDYDQFFNSENNFFVRNRAHIKKENIKLVKLEKGDIAESINDYISEHGADLLVLAKHNRSFFDRLFHRSLSKQMAYHTQIPLLVLNK
jgi:nucleotide-binding universal stress UspA family protein